MKKHILTIFISLLGLFVVKAQIPNSGFENWTKVLTVETPDGWSTLNSVTALSSLFTAEKASPGNPGSYYLKLTSKNINGLVVPGIAVSGLMNPVTYQALSGFPCSVRPTALTGKWQHMIYGSSQGSIEIQFTRWDNATKTRVSIGNGKVTLSGMAMSWANFSVPVNYTDASIPDSCIIILKASGATPTDKDYLWVDNLSFAGVSGIMNVAKELIQWNVYPNPATDQIQLHIQSGFTTTAHIEIIDITGKSHYQENADIKSGENVFTLPTSDLPSGMYFISISTDKSKHCCRFNRK